MGYENLVAFVRPLMPFIRFTSSNWLAVITYGYEITAGVHSASTQ